MSEQKKLRAVIHTMHPRRVFRISRSQTAEVRNVFVRVSAEGASGFGEASPNSFYGESPEGVLAKLQAAEPLVAGLKIETVEDIERAWHEIWCWVAPSRAAQCALDLALWDWLARRSGVSVAQLALGAPPHPVKTFCTIGISGPAELEEKVAELQRFPWIKIKSGAGAGIEPIRFVAQRTGAKLAVDANCSWGGIDIGPVSRELAELGVVFIEQPLSPQEDARMPEVSADSELPILADESCVLVGDVERLSGRFAGFNIKLVKCGGLTPSLAMWRRGREFGLHTMVGCNLESSLLIAAGAVAAQETEYADLDGAWLLADDSFVATGTGAPLPLREGVLVLGSGQGFGVDPRPDLLFGSGSEPGLFT